MKKLNRNSEQILEKYKTLFLAVLFLVAISLAISALKADKSSLTNNNSESKMVASVGSSVELAMVGDMLPHDTITNAAKSSEDYNYLQLISEDLAESFKKADLRFCNQEAPSAASIPVDGYPAFNAPPAFARDMSTLGCNLISVANNHAADKGLEGIKGTLDTWDGLSAKAVSGTFRDEGEANKLNIVEKNGIKIGFTAFNEVNNISPPKDSIGLNMLRDTERLEQQIKDLRAGSDVVVVSVHWGKEDSHEPTESQNKHAKKISDLGADVIIGTGPHVWQPYQVLDRTDGGKTHLWNSIGNALNSQTEQDQLISGVVLMNISKDSSGTVSVGKPRVLPTYMHYEWGAGVGMSQSQLLARKNIKWGLLAGSQKEIDKRNDFKTTEQEQIDNLRKYIDNSLVEMLQSY